MKSVELGSLCRPRQWPVVSQKQMNGEGFPVFGANGQIGWFTEFTHSDETIAVGCRGSCGEVHLVPPRSYINGNAMALDELDESRVDRRFLFRWLKHRGFRDVISGTSQPQIIQANIRRVDVPLPPLPEQKRVAAILDRADELRRTQAQHQESLARLTASIFQDHQRALNVAPQTLSSACRKITDGTHQAPTWAKEGIPFIFVSHVRNQRISLQTQKFISENTYAALTKHTPVEEGDVLYTCVGSYGHAALVPRGEKFLFQRHIAHLKPDQDQLLAGYLVYLLESPEVRRQADARATGIAQKTVTLAMIKDFQVRIPDITVQIEIMSKIDQLKKLELQSEMAVHRYDTLFASLQHRAFRGEL